MVIDASIKVEVKSEPLADEPPKKSGPMGKPGQRFNTPSGGEGDRVFYESLLKQNPESMMAMEWCVHYGVLGDEEAARCNKIVSKVRLEKAMRG